MLILGCGRLGGIFARIWREREPDAPLVCTVRNPESRRRLDGFDVRELDLLDAEAVRGVVAGHGQVLVAVSSGTDGPVVWREGLSHVASALEPGAQVVHVSSTGVYLEDGGGEVDESSPVGASGASKAGLHAAELALEGLDATILRCSGLVGPKFGPHRVLGRLTGTVRPDGWINLVWIDDVAQIIAEAFARGILGTFNVSASCIRRSDFYGYLTDAAGLDPIRWQGGPTGYRVRADRLASTFETPLRPVRTSELARYS